jgi:hypothetical protein
MVAREEDKSRKILFCKMSDGQLRPDRLHLISLSEPRKRKSAPTFDLNLRSYKKRMMTTIIRRQYTLFTLRVCSVIKFLWFLLATSNLFLFSFVASQQQHVYTDSFPTHDEYDMMALDPDSPYGTPYGGFSRATASRLASLPLKLPDVGEKLQEFEPMFTTVHDFYGRPFVCRVYHEDELDSADLKESMFNTPILKQRVTEEEFSPLEDTGEYDGNLDQQNLPHSSEGETRLSGSDTHNQVEDSGNSQGGDADDEGSMAHGAIKTKDTTMSFPKMDRVMLVQEIQQRLSRLSGLCAQMHPDWWSYEWCYDRKVTQFHINVDSLQAGESFDIQLEDITSLGRFAERKIISFVDENSRPYLDPNAIEGLDFAEGRIELARVKDTFLNGDVCPETGKPRVTESTLRCCSERVLSKSKGGLLKNGRPLSTDILTLVQTTEWSEAVCHYNITLCTPLLCDDTSTTNDSSNSNLKNRRSTNKERVNLKLDPETVKTMSVTEVLSKTFGETGDFCLQTGTGGWWVYEFCPGEYIRQFHETTLLDRLSGQASTAVDTEHILGRYISEDHNWLTKENQWMHVVNATETGVGSGTKSSTARKGKSNKLSNKLGGNGAYFFQEYTKGDVCDHEDVTDSAIKAGSFGEGGIERASTIQYSCGVVLDMNVKEDSTCHYIVDISVPTLCDHPLFKAPTSKKQVVKCLPLPQP